MVTIDSVHIRLPINQQAISISPPKGAILAEPEKIEVIDSAPVQVIDIAGARVTGMAKVKAHEARVNKVDLVRAGTQTKAAFMLREPRTWMSGLRFMGGISMPLLGDLLFRLGTIFVYFVLLWSLSAARRALPSNQCITIARNSALAIVVGAVSLPVLGLANRLPFSLISNAVVLECALAGSLALLAAGTLVVWPAAAWRVTPKAPRPPDGWLRRCLLWIPPPLRWCLLWVLLPAILSAIYLGTLHV
jgi:hypothetical protein